MLAKEPQVTLLGEHRLLQLGIHIEVILLDFLAVNLVEQCLDLRRVKTCKAQVKAAVLDVLQQIRQEGIGYRRISRTERQMCFVLFEFIKNVLSGAMNPVLDV